MRDIGGLQHLRTIAKRYHPVTHRSTLHVAIIGMKKWCADHDKMKFNFSLIDQSNVEITIDVISVIVRRPHTGIHAGLVSAVSSCKGKDLHWGEGMHKNQTTAFHTICKKFTKWERLDNKMDSWCYETPCARRWDKFIWGHSRGRNRNKTIYDPFNSKRRLNVSSEHARNFAIFEEYSCDLLLLCEWLARCYFEITPNRQKMAILHKPRRIHPKRL